MSESLTVATWNINSIRLRQDLVVRFLAEQQPDVLCLQETKCPNEAFPHAAFEKAGYRHRVVNGIKGYNGVAILSKRPLEAPFAHEMCGKADARHIAARIGSGARAVTVHNFYVPAGGDIADPEANPKFAHKLAFVEELKRLSARARQEDPRAILVGDLNIAPLEHDVWSHKKLLDVVSHTPIETESMLDVISEGEWVDAMRVLKPEPEKVYSWWSYRSPDWETRDLGRRLDHVWLGKDLGAGLSAGRIFRETRGWERPSDHVPVMVTLDPG
jgi:exodeoxyribonuclease III